MNIEITKPDYSHLKIELPCVVWAKEMFAPNAAWFQIGAFTSAFDAKEYCDEKNKTDEAYTYRWRVYGSHPDE